MGDMADMIFDSFGCDDYQTWEDMGGGFYPRQRRTNIECMFCGKKGLRWKYVNGRWALADKKGNVHVCNYEKDLKSCKKESKKTPDQILKKMEKKYALPYDESC